MASLYQLGLLRAFLSDFQELFLQLGFLLIQPIEEFLYLLFLGLEILQVSTLPLNFILKILKYKKRNIFIFFGGRGRLSQQYLRAYLRERK